MLCNLQAPSSFRCCPGSIGSRGCQQQHSKTTLYQPCSRYAAKSIASTFYRCPLVCTASSVQPEVTTAAASVPTATASVTAIHGHRPLPFAALSRVLLNVNNSGMFRTALNRQRQPVSGPMGLLLFILTVVAASIATIRGALVKKGKSCKSCRGFGLQRCRLCLGSGRVDWAAKLKHFDVCPLCMNKRFIVCSECGGHYHRPMFMHRRRQAGGAFEPSGQTANEGPIVLTLAMAAAGGSEGGQIMSSMND